MCDDVVDRDKTEVSTEHVSELEHGGRMSCEQ